MFDSKSQNCAFAEQAVSFLYDELEAENKAAFTSHLRNCAVCSDELAGFNTVRSTILDWRTQEFNLLESPTIKIEFDGKIQTQPPAVNVSRTDSWLDGLRKIFTFSPAFASVAALLLVIVFVGLYSYNFSGGRQIAEFKNKENTGNISTAEKNANQASNFENDGNANKKPLVADALPDSAADKKASFNDERESVAEPRIIKTANAARNLVKKETAAAAKTYDTTIRRPAFDSNAVVARNSSPKVSRQVPKLSNIEDDEEESSLRLTDLLEEAGGK